MQAILQDEVAGLMALRARVETRDPLRLRRMAGEIGELLQGILTSRDPGLPLKAYLQAGGGLFRDMTIHGFDLARVMLGEEPLEGDCRSAWHRDPALAANHHHSPEPGRFHDDPG